MKSQFFVMTRGNLEMLEGKVTRSISNNYSVSIWVPLGVAFSYATERHSFKDVKTEVEYVNVHTMQWVLSASNVVLACFFLSAFTFIGCKHL